MQLCTFGSNCGTPVSGPLFGGSVSLLRFRRDRRDETVVRNGGASPAVALPVLLGANGQGLITAGNAMNDALNVVQRASQNSAAAAVAKLAVRLAAGSDRLALLVRQDQDLSAEAKRLDDAVIAAVSTEPEQRDARPDNPRSAHPERFHCASRESG